MESPLIAVSRYLGSYDGTCWEFVNDDEMLNKLIGLVDFEGVKKRSSSPTSSKPKKVSNQTSVTKGHSSPSMPSTSVTNEGAKVVHDQTSPRTSDRNSDSLSQNSKPILMFSSGDAAREVVKEAKKLFEKMKNSVSAVNRQQLKRDWLYLIDSGGQIQFQQLLHALLPCASVLMLVVNIAEDLSSSSSTELEDIDGNRLSVSEFSDSNEALLERLVVMVNSSSKQLRAKIENDGLSGAIIPPKKLHILAIATHKDECKEDEVKMKEKKEKLALILNSLQDNLSCSCFSSQEVFYEVDGRKAVTQKPEDPIDPVIKSICEELKEQAFKVRVPLKWHVLEILLRKTASKVHGVVRLEDCHMIGNDMLQMANEEVESALKFFRLLNTLLYYPNSDVKDLVFVYPDMIYNAISDLAIIVCEIRNNKTIGKGTANLREAVKGYVSQDFIALSKTCTEICRSIPEFQFKLISLFEHLQLAVELPGTSDEKKFFMPAILPLVDPHENSPDRSTSCPFVFYFKSGATIGLFCTYIVHLLSIRSSPTIPNWSPINEEKVYANSITLKRAMKCEVQFVEYRDRFEIYCEDEEHRPEIRKELCTAMDTLIAEDKVAVEDVQKGFYCPSRTCQSEAHIATFDRDESLLCCSESLDVIKCEGNNVDDACWSWLLAATSGI